jgi:hypothetical protein
VIRLSLRQFRTQAGAAIVLLALAAILLGSTGSHLAHLYAIYAKAEASCAAARDCRQVSITIGKLDQLLELFGTALVAVPGLIGAFWGAPLISRELEHGTHRLAWTQSVSRTRWLAVKLAVVGIGSVAATGLLSLMVTWWSTPLDRAHLNRFGSGLFGERNVTPLGYAAFGFVLGVAVGLLVRRTLPAMAATLALFLGVRLGFSYFVRPHLLSPVHLTQPLAAVVQGFGQSNGGPPMLFTSVNLPGAWVFSTRVVDSSGHAITPSILRQECPAMLRGLGGGPPGGNPGGNTISRPHPVAGAQNALDACVRKLSPTYHAVVSYQPASRYWTLQWLETGAYAAAAAALAVLCFFWIRRGAN